MLYFHLFLCLKDKQTHYKNIFMLHFYCKNAKIYIFI